MWCVVIQWLVVHGTQDEVMIKCCYVVVLVYSNGTWCVNTKGNIKWFGWLATILTKSILDETVSMRRASMSDG